MILSLKYQTAFRQTTKNNRMCAPFSVCFPYSRNRMKAFLGKIFWVCVKQESTSFTNGTWWHLNNFRYNNWRKTWWLGLTAQINAFVGFFVWIGAFVLFLALNTVRFFYSFGTIDMTSIENMLKNWHKNQCLQYGMSECVSNLLFIHRWNDVIK